MVLLIEPVCPFCGKPGASSTLFNVDFNVSPGCHGAPVPGVVSIGPLPALLALISLASSLLIKTSAVLLGVLFPLQGVLDGLREGLFDVAGWLRPALGVVAVLKR